MAELKGELSIENILKEIEKIRLEHPYEVVGDFDTYTDYNQGWEDCAYRIFDWIENTANAIDAKEKENNQL